MSFREGLKKLKKKIRTLISIIIKICLSYNHLPKRLYAHALRIWYRDVTGNVLNIDTPRTFNEKIQWMKVYDQDPLKTLLADKYLVRDWVKKKIGEEYLIPLLAVYRSADEIDFDALPNSFVLKANHGSHMNYIVRDKSNENLDEIRRIARKWMKINFAFICGYELHYNDIPRVLIVEKYIGTMDSALPDYKFWCFDGKCHFIELVTKDLNQPHSAMYDRQWNRLHFTTGTYPLIEESIPMPEALPDMIKTAEKLAEGFPHVRVDLYLLDNGEIKFGEMTFTTSSGKCRWNPPEAAQA